MTGIATGAGPVVILGSYAPSLINFRGKLIEELVSRGHAVVAMAPKIDETVANELRLLGATPCEVQLSDNPLNPLELFGSLGRLTRIFSEILPSAVIPYTIQPATIGVLAAARAGVPIIVPMIEGLGYPFGKGGGLKRKASRLGAIVLYRWALPKSSLVVFLNPDDRPDLQKAGGYPAGKPSVVLNGIGVDIESFRPAPLPETPSFLMIARLIRDKGVFEYAAAARRLKTKYPNVRFALAGWRDKSPDCISPEQLQMMIDGGVDYLGKLADVRSAIGEASVFVLPSGYREGTPRSTLEAMAMGRPIVTCDTPGCRETVVEGENGLLVPPFNAEELLLAMEKLIRDPALSLRMGVRSREMAERRYDVRKVNHALLEAAGL